MKKLIPIILISLLLVACGDKLESAVSDDKPKKAISGNKLESTVNEYLNAFVNGHYEEVYHLSCERDTSLITLDYFLENNDTTIVEFIEVSPVKPSYTIKQFSISGNMATAQVNASIIDSQTIINEVMIDILPFVFSNAMVHTFSGDADSEQEFRDSSKEYGKQVGVQLMARYQKEGVPMTNISLSITLRKENDQWTIVHGWAPGKSCLLPGQPSL